MRRQYGKFSLSLEAREDPLTRFPTPFQKEWTLGRALREFADDLEHLDARSEHLVPGIERPPIRDGGAPPVGCQYWWASSMATVTATRG